MSCPTHESFSMIVHTIDDTARKLIEILCFNYFIINIVEEGLDFVHFSTIFDFEPCEHQVCEDITIIDDLEVEDDEEFFLTVIKLSGFNRRIKLLNSEKTFIIVDTDSKLFYTATIPSLICCACTLFSVSGFTVVFENDDIEDVEEGGIMEVCAIIPIDSDCLYRDTFSIEIGTTPDTACKLYSIHN